MKRLNKEYRLTNVGPIQMKVGTINKDDPKVVYVSGKCWLTPNSEIEYDEVFDELRKRLERRTRRMLLSKTDFLDKFILNLDINPESFILGKKKYFAFDVFFRQNDKEKKKLKHLVSDFNVSMSEIFGEMLNDLDNFGFSVEMAAK